jgi:hypothetical protein
MAYYPYPNPTPNQRFLYASTRFGLHPSFRLGVYHNPILIPYGALTESHLKLL